MLEILREFCSREEILSPREVPIEWRVKKRLTDTLAVEL